METHELQLHSFSQEQNGDHNLTEKEEKMYHVLKHINQCVSFAISDQMFQEWAKSICILMPDATITEIKNVVREYKLNISLIYDPKKGIQNIFIGIRSLRNEGMVR